MMTFRSFYFIRASARLAAVGWLTSVAGPNDALARETVRGRLAGGSAYARYERFNAGNVLSGIGKLDVGRWLAGARQPIRLRGWDFVGELTRIESSNRLSYDDGTTTAGFAPDAGFTTVAVAVAPPNRWIRASSGAGVWDKNIRPPTWNVALKAEPVRSLSASLELGSATGPPFFWTAHYGDDGGAVAWAGRTHCRTWETQWRPEQSLTVAARFTEFRLTPDSSRVPAGTAFSARPSGTLWHRSLEIEKAAPSGMRYIVGVMDIDLSGRLDGFKDGLRFGQIGIIEATWRQWRAALEHRDNWSAQIIRGQGELYAAGVINTWPFTEGLASLLGSRRHLIVGGRASLWILKTYVGKRLTPWAEASLTVHAYRIEPDLQMLTWQPLAFGMGIYDPRSTRLNVIRADIASVKLQWAIKVRRKTTLSTSLQQWIPLSVKKAALTGSPSGNDDDVAKAGHSLGKGLAVAVGVEMEW